MSPCTDKLLAERRRTAIEEVNLVAICVSELESGVKSPSHSAGGANGRCYWSAGKVHSRTSQGLCLVHGGQLVGGYKLWKGEHLVVALGRSSSGPDFSVVPEQRSAYQRDTRVVGRGKKKILRVEIGTSSILAVETEPLCPDAPDHTRGGAVKFGAVGDTGAYSCNKNIANPGARFS